MSEHPYRIHWCRRLPHGTCVAVELPTGDAPDEHSLPEVLTAQERKVAASLAPARRVSWVGGRVALRLAAREIGWDLDTIGSTPRGAPDLPKGIIGSIAHKTRLAVALVERAETVSIGVDLEELDRPRSKIAKLVLRPEEREQVERLDEVDRWTNVLTRFSLKEAIFKALDPFLQRYIGFQEASVEPLEDGTARLLLELKEGGPFEIEGHWTLVDGHVLTSVLVPRPQ